MLVSYWRSSNQEIRTFDSFVTYRTSFDIWMVFVSFYFGDGCRPNLDILCYEHFIPVLFASYEAFMHMNR